jgi:chromatin remodeling complex protein RSC6
MVRASSKQTKQTTPATVVQVVSTPSVETKKSKKSKTEKSEAPAAVVSAPVVETPAVVSEPPSSEQCQLSSKMVDFSAKLQQLLGLLTAVKGEFKAIEKGITRELRQAAKASNKKRKSNINRKPSGFVKPTRISDELAHFLGKEIGTELARTAVSKEINAYINAHKLQDSKNGRIIHPDEKLIKLLKVQPSDELTYFNLQRYMKHHFIKESVSA